MCALATETFTMHFGWEYFNTTLAFSVPSSSIMEIQTLKSQERFGNLLSARTVQITTCLASNLWPCWCTRRKGALPVNPGRKKRGKSSFINWNSTPDTSVHSGDQSQKFKLCVFFFFFFQAPSKLREISIYEFCCFWSSSHGAKLKSRICVCSSVMDSKVCIFDMFLLFNFAPSEGDHVGVIL